MNNSIDNNNNHCRDCCCAKSWEALGVHEYSGKSIPEHIAELKKDRDRLLKQYSIFEEVSPPDIPRSTFVQWCFEAWSNEDSLKQDRDRLKAERDEQRRLVIEHDQTKAELFDRIATVSSDRDRLLKACLQAATAMQSAWYELEPGKAVIGDQFIRQEDMYEKLAIVRSAIDYVTPKGKL